MQRVLAQLREEDVAAELMQCAMMYHTISQIKYEFWGKAITIYEPVHASGVRGLF